MRNSRTDREKRKGVEQGRRGKGDMGRRGEKVEKESIVAIWTRRCWKGTVLTS